MDVLRRRVAALPQRGQRPARHRQAGRQRGRHRQALHLTRARAPGRSAEPHQPPLGRPLGRPLVRRVWVSEPQRSSCARPRSALLDHVGQLVGQQCAARRRAWIVAPAREENIAAGREGPRRQPLAQRVRARVVVDLHPAEIGPESPTEPRRRARVERATAAASRLDRPGDRPRQQPPRRQRPGRQRPARQHPPRRTITPPLLQRRRLPARLLAPLLRPHHSPQRPHIECPQLAPPGRPPEYAKSPHSHRTAARTQRSLRTRRGPLVGRRRP